METNQQSSSERVKTADEEKKEADIKLSYFRGVPFHCQPFDINVLKEVVEFKPDPTDVFVVTYPKCGTTWAQYIVWEIINKGAPPPGPNKMMFNYFPHLEATGVEKLHELPRPRLMKTHLPFQLQPYHPSAKYIYVARNPWDCCVSYYHHIQVGLEEGEKLSFEKFVDHFVQGRLSSGDFFDHVFSWYAHKNDSNVLFLTYENMSVDRKGTMLKVAEFLGDEYYNVLNNDEEILSNCLKHSEFKYLKDLRMFIAKDVIYKEPQPQHINAAKFFRETMGSVDKDNVDLEKFREWEFFRKGVVGDWKNYFSDKHVRKFNDYIARKVSTSSIEDMWILRQ